MKTDSAEKKMLSGSKKMASFERQVSLLVQLEGVVPGGFTRGKGSNGLSPSSRDKTGW